MTPPDPPSRTPKYRILKALLWGGNHVMRWQLQHGLAPRAFALLETVGRRTGQPRQTCVGNGLMGDTFWVVAAHGQQADWVRNISKEPRVRVLGRLDVCCPVTELEDLFLQGLPPSADDEGECRAS